MSRARHPFWLLMLATAPVGLVAGPGVGPPPFELPQIQPEPAAPDALAVAAALPGPVGVDDLTGMEEIDATSGELRLRLPLGPELNVGPRLGYRLGLVHLGRLAGRDPAADQGRCSPFASNAGAGWFLHLGRLAAIDPAAPPADADLHAGDATARWLWVASDGVPRSFHELPGRSAKNRQGFAVTFSKDGSDLRLQQVAADRVLLEHPDGRVTTFVRQEPSPCWRFEAERDLYGNRLTLVVEAGAGGAEIWRVADSTGREHRLRFGAGLGGLRLETLDLAAFGGARATYSLVYEGPSALEGESVATDETAPSPSYLRRVRQPGGGDWVFETVRSGPTAGRLLELTLPSRGRLRYEYGPWPEPSRCGEADRRVVDGVRRRKLRYPGGAVAATWSWESELLQPAGSPADDPGASAASPCSPFVVRRTTIDSPVVEQSFDREIVYHAAARPGSAGSFPADGLPLAPDQPLAGQVGEGREVPALYLSREWLHCRLLGPCGAAQRWRSTAVAFAWELAPTACATARAGPACARLDPRRIAERTVFHTDKGRTIETRWLDWNGAGKPRRVVVTEERSGHRRREETRTDWSATGRTTLELDQTGRVFLAPGSAGSRPRPDQAWLLDRFNSRLVVAGGQRELSELAYDSRGALRCERRRREPGHRSPEDLVVAFELGTTPGQDAGLPVREIRAGGDGATLSTAEICPTTGTATNGTRFELAHAYVAGLRTSTRIASGEGGSGWLERRAIDPATGLVSATFDAAGRRTELRYDLLGRLVAITPDPASGLVGTEIRYRSSAEIPSSLEVRQTAGAETLGRAIRFFDPFGRTVRWQSLRPGPDGKPVLAERHVVRDPLGRTLLEGAWRSVGQPAEIPGGTPSAKPPTPVPDPAVPVATSWRFRRNALGQLLSAEDGLRRLEYQRDDLGRLLGVGEAGRPLFEWRWGSTPETAFSLERITRHTWLPSPAGLERWSVTEETSPVHAGRARELWTTIEAARPDGALRFRHSFLSRLARDPLGRLASLDYPTCTSATCAASPTEAAPAHRVELTSRAGQVLRIASSLGFAALVHRDLEGRVTFLRHSNGLETVYSPSPPAAPGEDLLVVRFPGLAPIFSAPPPPPPAAAQVPELVRDNAGRVLRARAEPSFELVWDALDGLVLYRRPSRGRAPTELAFISSPTGHPAVVLDRTAGIAALLLRDPESRLLRRFRLRLSAPQAISFAGDLVWGPTAAVAAVAPELEPWLLHPSPEGAPLLATGLEANELFRASAPPTAGPTPLGGLLPGPGGEELDPTGTFSWPGGRVYSTLWQRTLAPD